MSLMSPEQVEKGRSLALPILEALNQRILGQEELVKRIVVACLARGHVLLEGLPGLGKTELVKGMAGLLGLEFKRIQFTPDLLPGDITGAPILEEGAQGRKMVFKPGPIFGNLILADEINRASPRTQSAMLEAMQEGRVTILGETRSLPEPFWTLATQNPIDMEGTYPLPEAQLDRFMFKLNVHRVSPDVMKEIITSRRRGAPPASVNCLSPEQLNTLFSIVDQVFLPEPVASYISRLVSATHPDSEESTPAVQKFVRFGASPRAAIALAEAGRAHALIDGKANVGFDDVRAIAFSVLGHRVKLDYQARLEEFTMDNLISDLLENVPQLTDNVPHA